MAEIKEQIPIFKEAFTNVWNLVLGWVAGKLFIDTDLSAIFIQSVREAVNYH